MCYYLPDWKYSLPQRPFAAIGTTARYILEKTGYKIGCGQSSGEIKQVAVALRRESSRIRKVPHDAPL
jgi:hypothetical protein